MAKQCNLVPNVRYRRQGALDRLENPSPHVVHKLANIEPKARKKRVERIIGEIKILKSRLI